MDGDGNNVYGTAGYAFFGVSAIGTAAGNGPTPYSPAYNATSFPSFVSAITPVSGVQFNWGAGLAQIDNPALAPGSSVANVLSGLIISRSIGQTAIATITLNGTIPANFRIGVMTDNSTSIWDVPGELQIKSSNGDVSAPSLVALGNLIPDVYFFDVSGAHAGDVLTVYVTFGGSISGGGSYNYPSIGGFTFDVTPSAPPTLATLLTTANQTLFDDFLGSDLNAAVWSRGMRFPHINNELQGYNPGNVTVANGLCTITQKKESVANIDMYGTPTGGTYSYSSGCLQTYSKWTQTYGYYEAKIRASTCKGGWPAFWLLPDRGPSSPTLDQRTAIGNTIDGASITMGNEIDALEYMNTWKNPSTNLSFGHAGAIWQYNVLGASFGDYTYLNQLVNPDVQFHTYGVMWAPGKLDYYIDGVLVMTGTSPNIAICPSYMILNCAVTTDNWLATGPTTAQIDASVPATMDIDYVKVYSLPGTGGGSANLALNKPATASSVQSSGYEAAKAVDGDATTTRWSSGFSDAQWIYVDLGATYSISEVKLTWEAAYGKSFQIQVSNNATSWTNIYSTTTGTGGVNDLTGLSGSGRYVRMNGTLRGTSFGYSLFEFAVYGSSGTNTPIPVVNSGFETGDLTGWKTVNANGYAAGAWVVNNATDPNRNYSVPLPGTGAGTFYMNIEGYDGNPAEIVYQDITANGQGNAALQPNTTYTLTVAVGEGTYNTPNNGYISIINGVDPTGVTLQTAQMSTLGFGNYANNFKDLTVSFTTGATVSGHLTIAIGTPQGYPSAAYASIDNVRLTKH